MMGWTQTIAFRFLRSRSRGRFFTPMALVAVSSLAFAVVAALVSLSVMTGFESVYQKAILGFNAHLVLLHEGSDQGLEAINDEAIVEKSPFLFREGLGLVSSSNDGAAVTSVVLKGIDPLRVPRVYHLRTQNLTGEDFDWMQLKTQSRQGLYPLVLGTSLAEKFFPNGISSPAIVRLLIPKMTANGSRDIRQYAQNFEVVGVFESGLYEFDSQFVFIDIPALQKSLGLGDAISGYEMKLRDPALADDVADRLRSNFHNVDAVPWTELNEPLFSAMKMEKGVFVVIMFLILLVAAFNVMGIILMMVRSKRREIFILLASGARESEICRIFSWQGGLVGFSGLAGGFMLTALLLWSLQKFAWLKLDPQIYFIDRMPVVWDAKIWILFSFAALLLCVGLARFSASLMIRGKNFKNALSRN